MTNAARTSRTPVSTAGSQRSRRRLGSGSTRSSSRPPARPAEASVTGPNRSLDELLAAARLDPAAGVQVVAAKRLPGVAFDPSLPLIVLRSDVGVDSAPPLPGRHAHAGSARVLERLYPNGHVVHSLSDGRELTVPELTDAELANGDWLVPPVNALDNFASPHGMAAISARLRATDGCPWDRRQTHASQRPFVLEEAYEMVDAIEHGTPGDLAEELGDLFLQSILHAQLAAQ